MKGDFYLHAATTGSKLERIPNIKWLVPYTFIQATPVEVVYGNDILMEYAIFWYIARATSEAFWMYKCRFVGVPLRYFYVILGLVNTR
jgi:hypothetical protein